MAYFTPGQINSLFPVVGLIAFQGGIVIRRGCNVNLNRRSYLHERKKIYMVSKRSLAKLALLVRGSGVQFTSLMTLTYGANYPLSGRTAKKHLNHFLINAKRNFGPFEHIWVLEFQARGAVHFHIATTLPEPNSLQRDIFAQLWAAISTPYAWLYCQLDEVNGKLLQGQTLLTNESVISSHRSLRSWEKVRKGDSLHHYFAKYCTKIIQKKVPPWYADVGRFWAASKGVKLPDGEYFHGSEETVRQVGDAYGRNLARWNVLPKIILLG